MLYLPSFSATQIHPLMLNGQPKPLLPPLSRTVLVNARYFIYPSTKLENGYLVEYANDLGA